jgi:hypothetical protein
LFQQLSLDGDYRRYRLLMLIFIRCIHTANSS